MYLLWAWPFAIVAFILNMFISIIPFYIMKVLKLSRLADDWLYANNRLISNFLFFLLGIKLNVNISKKTRDLFDSKQAVCFFSNHTSMLDIPAVVCATKVKTGFIAKAVIKKIPCLNLIAISMRCIFIDRSSRQDSIDGIRQGVNTIKDGHSMLIFPEGTRSKTGEIAPFKHGSFRLAIESGSPIIPVTISGLRPAMEDRKKFFGHYEAEIVIDDPVYILMDEDRETRFNKIEKIEEKIRETYASLGDKNV